MSYYKNIFERRDRLLSQIDNIIKIAIDTNIGAIELTKLFGARIMQSEDYDSLPRWARLYVEGYWDAIRKIFERDNIEWRVKLYGKYIKGCDVPKGRWADVEQGAFFYKNGARYYPPAKEQKEEA